MKFGHIVSSLVVLALGVGMQPSAAQAEPERVLRGEYIVSSIYPRRDTVKKVTDLLETAAGDDLDVEARGSDRLLLTDTEDTRVNDAAEGGVERTRRNDACLKFKRLVREERQESRSEGRVPFHLVNCDPNGVVQVSIPSPVDVSQVIPNDPSFSTLWGMNQPNDVDMNAPEGWAIRSDCSSQIVAVVDTGIQANHPDLVANMWQNPRESLNGVDDDGNGYVDDIYGINAINGSGNPADDNGHGTHVAGTIGGVGNNGTGVTGVCHRVKMIGTKFLNSGGGGSLWDAVKALDYINKLKQRGENIVLSNNSWGGGGFYSVLYGEINEARSLGILFVAAAGNNNNNNDANPTYPADYPLDNIISVGAIDAQGQRAWFSNYGATAVDIAAPGVGIVSTWLSGGYRTLDGTSMAAPHISGALALIKARSPQIANYQQLRESILRSDTTKSVAGFLGLARFSAIPNLAVLMQDPGRYAPPLLTPTSTPTPGPTSTPTPTPTATPTPTPTASPTPGYYDITGRVTASSGEVIGGATMTLLLRRSSGTDTVTATTGANGEYRFASVMGPVDYDLSVTSPGRSFSPVRNGKLLWSTMQNFIALPATLSLSARVIRGSDGQPIQGVSISNGTSVIPSDAQGLVDFGAPFGTSYNLEVTLPRGARYIVEPRLSGTMAGPVRRTFVVYY